MSNYTRCILKLMTDIPGTGKIKSVKPESTKEVPTLPLSVVNINDLKKPKIENTKPEVWYNKFFIIVAFAVLSGLITFLLALKYKSLLIIIPIGPIAILSSWYIKKIIDSLEAKLEKHKTVKPS